MLCLVEVSDSIRFLESRLEEMFEKADAIDAVAGRVKGLPIHELLARVDTLEMTNDMSEDFGATLDVVRNEIVDVNTRLNFTMRAMENHAPAGGAISVSKVKILKPKPFCGARDAKALENFIFDLEQYFKTTNTVTEEAKNALKKELRSQFFPENVEMLARRELRELKHTGNIRDDSQDVRRHQSSLLGRNRNSRLSSPKAAEGDKRSGEDQAEARCLRIHWEKDSERMKAVNFVTLPIVRLVKQMMMKLGGWKGLVDFVVVKMDNFDVVLGMEFLFDHQVILMPLAKCLVITDFFPPSGSRYLST
ncbi:uncharacterized protein E5676_scaffold2047G00180 [Cucumis melo var. makuwa]|uniref:Senescence-specific cysteine protease sag39 n=1 Tax=Cucumis melo var. makuwa TaxID=1194695 RepID=A0A5A7TBY4_CUCMM|nr:uncharacterized protein E6C27_scaffold84G001970 [Cucumis melo var. makuwa]TYK14886.1 uncharacterized protein E5676_scaffold2047G00180 [Cucumis melo var. makuwa]